VLNPYASLLLDVCFGMVGPEPTTSSKTNSAQDFLLEWYKLQREHELELNKATLAYELELARLLILLNGGAAGAFLTLIGTVWKEQARHDSLGWVCVAIIAWLIGLVVASFAIHRAYEIQRDYSTAYRYRRQLEELRRINELGVEFDDLGIMVDHAEPQPIRVWNRLSSIFNSMLLGILEKEKEPKKLEAKVEEPEMPPVKVQGPENAQKIAQKIKEIKGAANCMRKEASARSKRIWLLQYSAVVMFVLGSLFALVAFYRL